MGEQLNSDGAEPRIVTLQIAINDIRADLLTDELLSLPENTTITAAIIREVLTLDVRHRVQAMTPVAKLPELMPLKPEHLELKPPTFYDWAKQS